MNPHSSSLGLLVAWWVVQQLSKMHTDCTQQNSSMQRGDMIIWMRVFVCMERKTEIQHACSCHSVESCWSLDGFTGWLLCVLLVTSVWKSSPSTGSKATTPTPLQTHNLTVKYAVSFIWGCARAYDITAEIQSKPEQFIKSLCFVALLPPNHWGEKGLEYYRNGSC